MDSWYLDKGDEQLLQFHSCKLGKTMVLYDYRDIYGELFSTVCDSLEVARQRRDEWLKEKEKETVR